MDTRPFDQMSPDRRPARGRRGAMLTRAAVAVLAVALAGAIWHIVALEAYVAAGRPYDATAQRKASAELAWRLEPWNVPFAWRAIALRGLDMLEKGDVDGAYWLVEPYSLTVHGTDATFVSIYQRIVAIKTPIDSGKAHVAHGLDPNNNFGTGASGTPTSSAPSTAATP